MFADFMFEAAGQIVLQAAKLHYMSNGQMNAPVVFRVGSGALRSAGPHHSGCLSSHMGAHPRPDRLHAVQSGRRQGPDEDGAARRRTRSSCWRRRRCSPARAKCRSASISCRSAWPRSSARAPTSRSSRRANSCIARWKRPTRSRAEGIDCEVIDLRTIMPLDVATVADSVSEDPPAARRRRGLRHVRHRRRDRARR